MEQSFRDRLDGYLRAGYPAIYLQTYEENRAIAEIARVAKDRGRGVMTWELDQGWTTYAGKASARKVNAPSPQQALQEAIGGPGDMVYVLKDFHPFLPIPEIYRQIKSTLEAFAGSRRTFIITSCRQAIPPELEKELTMMELTLPTREELGMVLNASIEAAKDRGLNDVVRNSLIEAALGLTATEAENAFSLARIRANAFDKEAVKVVQAEKAGTIKKGGLLEWWPNVEPLDSLGGAELLKQYVSRAKVAFSPEARDFGIDGLKGLLMVGPAGVGKSLAAKVTAAAFEWPLFYLDMGRVFGSLVGQSEERARAACQLMVAVAPCVILMDEVEKGMAGLQGSGVTDSGVSARVMSTFLTFLAENTAPVYIVGTSNSIAGMPPELVDRFDACFFLDLPTEAERGEILSIHLKKRGRNPKKFNISELALASEGHTGRDIERVVKWGLIAALEAGREVTTHDIVEQLSTHVPTVQIKGEDIAAMREWAKKHGVRPASLGNAPAVSKPKRRLDMNPLNN